MENHHFSWENPLFLWPFSIAMLVHQRVPRATEPRNLLGTPLVATGRPFAHRAAHRQRWCCTTPRAPGVLRDHPPAP